MISAVAVASLIALAALTAGTWFARSGTAQSPATDAQSDPEAAAGIAVSEVAATSAHPVYRYSVIPGGAHNRGELLNAISRDQVVADHYRSVALERVRVERLPEERRAYVSYRIGDRVYWTKHQVKLPAGEAILTDGVTQIRARCGNCISYAPQLPTSAEEPDVVEFDALSPADPDASRMSAAALPVPAPAAAPSLFPSSSGNVQQSTGGPGEIGSALAGASTSAGFSSNAVVPRALVSGSIPEGAGSDRSPAGSVGSSLGASDPPPGNAPEDALFPGGVTGSMSVPLARIPGSPMPGDFLPPSTPAFNPPGGDYRLHDELVQPVPVPEPSTILLLGTGTAGVLWRRLHSRRERRNQTSPTRD